MEAAALFTVGALRKVESGCLLTVSDIVVEGEFKRISDDELRAAVDRMTRVALRTVTASISGKVVFLVNPASDNGATGRRWPQLAHRAAERGLEGATLFSERPGHLGELAAQAASDGAGLVVAVGGDGTLNEVANGLLALPGGPARARGDPARHGMDFARSHGIPRKLDAAIDVAHARQDRRDRRGSRLLPRVGRIGRRRLLRQHRERRHERRRRAPGQRDDEGARRADQLLRRARARLRHAGATPSSRSRPAASGAAAR